MKNPTDGGAYRRLESGELVPDTGMNAPTSPTPEKRPSSEEVQPDAGKTEDAAVPRRK